MLTTRGEMTRKSRTWRRRADDEGRDDEEEQDVAPARARAGEEIGDRVPEHERQRGHRDAERHGLEQDAQVERVTEGLGVVREGHRRAGGILHEREVQALVEHHPERQDEERQQEDEERRQQERGHSR